MNEPVDEHRAYMDAKFAEGDLKVNALNTSIVNLSTKVDALTKSVEGMVEVWTAGKAGYGIAKGIGNMLLWLGKVLVAVAVAWAAFKGWLRGLV